MSSGMVAFVVFLVGAVVEALWWPDDAIVVGGGGRCIRLRLVAITSAQWIIGICLLASLYMAAALL
jgi:hypothetical protein